MEKDLLQRQFSVERILTDGLNKKFDFDSLKDFSEYPHQNPRIEFEKRAIRLKNLEKARAAKKVNVEKKSSELNENQKTNVIQSFLNNLFLGIYHLRIDPPLGESEIDAKKRKHASKVLFITSIAFIFVLLLIILLLEKYYYLW